MIDTARLTMAHPRITSFDCLRTPDRSARELGYRLPAEWEPHACVWVSWPHNVETWPGRLDQARAQFAAWIDTLRSYVPVTSTQACRIRTNDSWIRDFGPVFMLCDAADSPPAGPESPLPAGGVACHDFHFNGWGAKYELREYDDLVPQYVARHLSLPVWVHDFVLEGGAIDANGRGTLLTTEQCLLNPNRNPAMTRDAIERYLGDALAVTNVIWLAGGITGDDTDGHIDDVARFVGPNVVLTARCGPEHPDHAMLERNFEILQAARDERGEPLELLELPMPEPIWYDYPPDRFDPGGRAIVPASYANFLITNGAVFVPVFGQRADEIALRTIEAALPGRRVVPVRAEHLVIGLGTLHCLSMQQPAAPAC